jgi:glycosyltransferase involved in cell wall biosynthesis
MTVRKSRLSQPDRKSVGNFTSDKGKHWPRITIVTPSFNQGQYLEQTIVSILSQKYPNLEYIIIDGGSSDHSLEIIRKYERWITYWTSEKDNGQAHAINKGFQKSTGDIHAYLNSDDLLTDGTLIKVAEVFENCLKSPVIVSFAGIIFGEDREDELRLPQVYPYLKYWLSYPESLFQPSTFWTKVLHDRVGEFSEELDFCFDKEFFLRCVFKYGQYIPVKGWVASKFRLHNQSKTSLLDKVMREENDKIGRYYRDIKHYREILTAQENIQKSFESDRLPSRLRLLVCAAWNDPRQLRNRFYLGALRKLIVEK